MQAVAEQIGFSQYHFHRIFTAMVGESVKDYLRKRRLMVAAQALLSSDSPILALALRSGFDSQEAFTRAFRKMFGVTPGAYRRFGSGASAIHKPPATDALVRHLTRGITMKPVFEKREAELSVGIGGSFFPGQTDAIGALWQKFLPRLHEISNRKDYALGICMSKHPSVEKVEGDKFVYFASVPVFSLETVPEGMVACEIPAATYAKFTHKGPIADIKHTVEYIWGTWIPESGYELQDAVDFELYDDRFDPVTESGEVDIFVPIKE